MKVREIARDPLVLSAWCCYAGNRWLVPAAMKGPFLRGYFNDVWLLPAALPLMVWVYSLAGMRPEDGFPNATEIGLHWVVWSIAAEWIGPQLFPWVRGDWRDCIAYAAGGLLCLVFWRGKQARA